MHDIKQMSWLQPGGAAQSHHLDAIQATHNVSECVQAHDQIMRGVRLIPHPFWGLLASSLQKWSPLLHTRRVKKHKGGD